MSEKVSGEVQGIPIELIRYDEKSGEICIGDECLTVRLGKENEIVIEYDPDSQKCNRETRKIIEKFLQQILGGGKKPKIRVVKKTANSQ